MKTSGVIVVLLRKFCEGVGLLRVLKSNMSTIRLIPVPSLRKEGLLLLVGALS